jgi:hypothetical protein
VLASKNATTAKTITISMSVKTFWIYLSHGIRKRRDGFIGRREFAQELPQFSWTLSIRPWSNTAVSERTAF